MPRRIEDQYVYKRYLNGACRIDRTCWECGKQYVGDRNLCPTCRDKKRHRIFGASYHRKYYRKKLSKAVIQKDLDKPVKQDQKDQLRKAAFEKQKCRIRTELLVITLAKLDPDNNTIEEIERAGVSLQGLTIERNHGLTQIFTDKMDMGPGSKSGMTGLWG